MQFADAGAVAVYIVLVALGGLMIMSMITMIFQRELAVGEFLLWLVAYVGMSAATVNSLGASSFPLIFVLTLCLGIAVPAGSWFYDRFGAAGMRLRDLDALLKLAREHPDWDMLYSQVGKLHYEQGNWEEAERYLEEAYKRRRDPETAFFLKKARQRAVVGDRWPVQCPECGQLSARAVALCPACGRDLPPCLSLTLALQSRAGRWLLLAAASLGLTSGALLLILHRGAPWMYIVLLSLGLCAAFTFLFMVKRYRQPGAGRP